MRQRIDVLIDLISFRGKLIDLQNELSTYPWDVAESVLTISKSDFVNILERSVENEISFEELEDWANTIECRDDLDFEFNEIQEAIFELANPAINGSITKSRLIEMIDEISNR